ncbi:penicillin-binding protein 1C [Henriciella algicola]|uniref:peptidoglycan glycosyltransferase n=1 Tax=Henriciella algicola TaxID=1608422 RepID=A0A399RMR7_9PROT|nr:penicillin-binding protein 1C [Henriciella algicola]RIJ30985.1 penicillin-binding protein 1C [Henriciella algicola]
MIWLKRSAIAIAAALTVLFALDRIFPPPLERGETVSQLVSDRRGRPLRAIPTPDNYWRFQAHLEDIDPIFIEALLEVEDQRFWRHGGVDWTGMVRAAWSSVLAGRVVSGGSTITMQTARLLEPRPRTIPSKLIEMFRAHQIEARLSKEEILELYLTLTPYGGNIEGIRAASWRYFGRSPDRLSDDQIALLIALPQSPEVRRPDLRPQGADAGRRAIVAKLERLGYLDAGRAEEARTSQMPTGAYAFPSDAWHATARAARDVRGDVRASLDARLQAEMEALALAHATEAGRETQLAILVVDIPTRAVRASVGSASRDIAGGWLDLTAQARSPGSALKPFIYAMAFDDGEASALTRIADLPKRFASYQPDNFDRTFRGDVRVSDALQHSLNVPAVLALDRVGPERFAATLALAGAPPRIYGGADHEFGLALALGGAGLTARELAILYAALGDGGRAKPLVWTAEEEAESRAAKGFRMMEAESAGEILSILRRAPTPEGRMPGRLTADAPQIAFKTGTSYGFRDAWAAGVSGDHAIVVWVGRADGAPRPGETGRTAALPILFEVADRAAYHLGGDGDAGARLMPERQHEADGALTSFDQSRAEAPHILFPPKDAELWSGEINGAPARPFVFAGRGEGKLRWFIDGEPSDIDDAGLPIWQPTRAGFYQVRAVDEDGRTSEVRVRVIGIGES